MIKRLLPILLVACGLSPAFAGESGFDGFVRTDGTSPLPLQGVEVRLYRYDPAALFWDEIAWTISDTNGFYSIVGAGEQGDGPFDPLPDGDYKLVTANEFSYVDEIGSDTGSFGSANYDCTAIQCAFVLDSEGQVFTISSGFGFYFVEFGLSPGRTVSGQVSDGATPVEGVEVCLFDAATDGVRYCAESDPGGSYATPAFGALTDVHVAVTETRLGFDPATAACDGTPESAPAAALVPEVRDGSGGYFTFRGGAGPDLSGALTETVGTSSATIDFLLDPGVVFCGVVVEEGTTPTPIDPATVKFYDAQGNLVYATGEQDRLPSGAFRTFALPADGYFAAALGLATSPVYVANVFDGASGAFCLAEQCGLRALEVGQGLAGTAGAERVVDFQLEPGTELTGTVLGELPLRKGAGPKTPIGLEFVAVCAFEAAGAPLEACVETGPGGGYAMILPRAGTRLFADTLVLDQPYVAELYSTGGGVVSLPFDPLDGELLELTVERVSGVDFSLDLGGRLVGEVFDDVSFLPVDGYVVNIHDDSGNFLASAPGSTAALLKGPSGAPFRAPALPAGASYRIVIEATGDPDAAGAAYLSEVFVDGGEPAYCLGPDGCDPLAGSLLPLSVGTVFEPFDLTLGGTLIGRVDDETAPGVGIAGAAVSVFDASNVPLVTVPVDGSGVYRALLPPDPYFLRSDAPGYRSEVFDDQPCPSAGCGPAFPPPGITPDPVVVSTTQIAGMKDFALARPGVSLGGLVRQADGSTPIAGADACLFDGSGAELSCLLTDGTGAYRFADLPAATYFVSAAAAGFQAEVYDDLPCFDSCFPIEGTPINLAGQDILSINFSLDGDTFSISGIVFEGGGEPERGPGGPVAGAQVCAFDATEGALQRCATSDPGGAYEIIGLLPGGYTVRAAAEGFRSQLFDRIDCAASCEPLDGDVIVLGTGGSASGVDFELSEVVDEFSVTGVVRQRAAGRGLGVPLAGAEVCLFDRAGAQVGSCEFTGTDGSYGIGPVVAGRYTARATATGFAGQLFDGIACEPGCDVTAGTELVLDGDDESGPGSIDFLLSPLASATLSGTVRIDGVGAPLPGVTVRVVDGAGTLVGAGLSRPDGAFLVDELAGGSYFVFADGQGPGFYSEVFAGATEPGIVCSLARCTAVALTFGEPIALAPGGAVTGIDFDLEPGAEITGPTAAELDQLGSAVAVCDSRMAIGVPGDDDAGVDAGAVLVYHRSGSGYTFFEKLLPGPDPDGGSLDGLRYGASLDCSGDTLVIGAPADATGAKGPGAKESAFIMQMAGPGSFQQLQQLVAANLGMAPGAGFGSSVAINGQTLAVGAPGMDGKGGVAVVSNQSVGDFPWQASFMITDPETTPGADFGAALDVGEGGVIGVGAPLQQVGGQLTSGVAQMFTNITGSPNWTSVGKIVNPNGPGTGDAFGASIALDGFTMAVGAPGDDSQGPDAGAAGIFEFDGSSFIERAFLFPGDGVGGESFGSAVSLVDGQIAVGARNGNGAEAGTGAAYLYGLLGGSWDLDRKLAPRLGAAGDGFGASIDFDGTTLVVGAPNSGTSGIGSGRAEAFTDPDTLFGSGFDER